MQFPIKRYQRSSADQLVIHEASQPGLDGSCKELQDTWEVEWHLPRNVSETQQRNRCDAAHEQPSFAEASLLTLRQGPLRPSI